MTATPGGQCLDNYGHAVLVGKKPDPGDFVRLCDLLRAPVRLGNTPLGNRDGPGREIGV
jgi:hypothetical protein